MEQLKQQYEAMGISSAVYEYGEKALARLRERFDAIDRIAEYNQAKVIAAMQKNNVSAACFAATTGYGYDDLGRDNLEKVYADVFHTEAALVRPQITCGTHALTVALSANLLPGDELLSPVGLPYDTLQEVIGIRESPCSLAEYGVSYRQVDLLPDGSFDYDRIKEAINEKTKLITIQRSKGYATRPTFSVTQIGELISFCKAVKPDVLVMVDNCYGEFVETIEPSDVGADMVVGSLIKNPGGGLAPTGGYIVGFLPMSALMATIIKTFEKRNENGLKPAEKRGGARRYFLVFAIASLLGTIVCYTFGSAWFIGLFALKGAEKSIGYVLSVCVVPFILPDLLKIALASYLGAVMCKTVRKNV